MIGGEADVPDPTSSEKRFVTPCGRYRIVQISGSGDDDDGHLEVRTVANNRPLFRMARFSLHRRELDNSRETIERQIKMLGDNGPLVLLAAGGHALEIVDCDIPSLAQTLNSTSFHVTSQAPPAAKSTVPVDYQITVNNPGAVATYRLRNPTPGVALSPQGLLRFTAPDVTVVTRVPISTEIEGKDGQVVLHEFPIFVLP